VIGLIPLIAAATFYVVPDRAHMTRVPAHAKVTASTCVYQPNGRDPAGELLTLSATAQIVDLPCFGTASGTLGIPAGAHSGARVGISVSSDQTLGAVPSKACIAPGIAAQPCGRPIFFTALEPGAPVHFANAKAQLSYSLSDTTFSTGYRFTAQVFSGTRLVRTLANLATNPSTPQTLSIALPTEAGVLPAQKLVVLVYEQVAPLGIEHYFPVPAGGAPTVLAVGPDGALWFTDGTADKIGRITLSGNIREFAVPTAGAFPFGIAAGPDGALWFTERRGNKIGRITTAGFVTHEYALPASFGGPGFLTRGPDGAMWFTNDPTGKSPVVGRITTSGSVQRYVEQLGDADRGSKPRSSQACDQEIRSGSDGALWFASPCNFGIGRITTTGVQSWYFQQGAADDEVLGGFTTAAGGIWWSDSGIYDENAQAYYAVISVVVGAYPGISSYYDDTFGDLTVDDTGIFWVAGDGGIYRAFPRSSIELYFPLALERVAPASLLIGPDSALWYVDGAGVGRLSTGALENI
jgi:virginiamycin B lyase